MSDQIEEVDKALKNGVLNYFNLNINTNRPYESPQRSFESESDDERYNLDEIDMKLDILEYINKFI